MIATCVAQCALLLGSGTASASVACPGDERIPSIATAPEAAASLVCDLNAIRAQHGLRPLRWDWRLWWVARDMATDLATSQRFSHTASDGSDLETRAAPSGYLTADGGGLLLENLGWADGLYSSPLATVLGWMDSDRHRAIVLDPDLEDVGVGMAEGPSVPGGAVGMFYVAEFGSRGSQTTSLAALPQASKPTATPRKRGGCRRTRRARVRTGAPSGARKLCRRSRRR